MKIKAFLEWAEMGFILAIMIASCSTIKYIPVEKEKVIRDSIYVTETIVERDSCIIRDYIKLPDTLRLESKNAIATSWLADSTLKGSLIDKPIKSSIKTITEVRDSIIIKEVPVEVTKEVKYIPGIYKWSLATLIIEIVLCILVLVFKIFIKK